ncbi:MAG TPA: Tad domain-containing protein [Candidatus Limnocylindria bacterium]|nr:Tad domain-containing protein [Candidatus Limnocylindria bacterium]
MLPTPKRTESGQVLVIVAMGMIALVAMVGLVIDGGFAWAQQRENQNGADAAAKAGTVVVQHLLAGVDTPAPNDFDVACAVDAAATANGAVVEEAEYVDFQGDPLAPTPVMVGTCVTDLGVGIPAGAQGVRSRTSQTFETFLMQVVGQDTLTTEADAIAVVGELSAIGGALPVTFPEVGTVCDDLELDFEIRADDGDGTYEPFEIIDEADANASNLAVVPLCTTAPGSVGWLDWECGQNLKASIEDPCEVFIPIPAWVQTQTGNVNSLEAEINAYAGSQPGVPEAEDSVLAIPVHDFTCDDDLADNQPTTDCSTYPDWSGVGNTLNYHIPYWIGFKIDQANVQGGDNECSQAPGTPLLVGQGGQVGCLKGWFVDRFDAPGPIVIGPIAPGSNVPMTVTLIN